MVVRTIFDDQYLTSNFRIVRACKGYSFWLPFAARLFEMFVYNEGDWKVSIKQVLVSAVAVAIVGTAFAAQSDNSQATMGAGQVRFDSAIANGVVVPQVGTETELTILKLRQSELANQTLYIGGMVRAAALYSRLSENYDGSTSVHSHVSNGRTGYKTASQLNVPEVSLLSVADINAWATGVVALDADNVGRDGTNDNIGVDQAYVLLGDLNSSSIYGFAGKKDVDFGNFTSVDFYTMPLDRLAFQVGATDSVGVGFNNSGFNAVLTAMNGGSNNSTTADATAYTQNSNNINNFAVNLDYGMTTNNVAWGVGAGYLNGGRYSYTKSDAQRNGAWDLNGHFNVNSLQVLAEYDRTAAKANGVITPESTIQGYNLGAAYGFPIMGHNSSVNADFSRLETSALTASQFVLGWNNELVNDVWMGVEWAYNKGAINGSTDFATTEDITAVPGANDSKNNTLLLNLTATF